MPIHDHYAAARIKEISFIDKSDFQDKPCVKCGCIKGPFWYCNISVLPQTYFETFPLAHDVFLMREKCRGALNYSSGPGNHFCGDCIKVHGLAHFKEVSDPFIGAMILGYMMGWTEGENWIHGVEVMEELSEKALDHWKWNY